MKFDMSAIEDSVNRIKNKVADAYTAAEGKGAVMPESRKVANLANCIDSIELTDWASLGDELLRAEAYSKTVDTSNQYLMLNSDNLYTILDATSVSASSVGYKVIIDGKLYSYTKSTNSISQLGTDTNYNQYIDGSSLYIKNNNELWGSYTSGYANDNKLLDINGPVIGSTNYFIYDGKLYSYTYLSCSLLDTNGIWTDVFTSCGIRDGLIFGITGGVTQIDTRRVSLFSGNSNNYYCVFESNPYQIATFYYQNKSSTPNPNINYYTKPSKILRITTDGGCFCEDGKYYERNSSTPSTNQPLDKFNSLFIYENYIQLSGKDPINVSNAYLVTKKYINTSSGPYIVGLGSDSQSHFLRFGTSNATKSYATVAGNDPQNTTLSGNTMTYNNMLLTRDTGKDGVFTFYPDDLKNKTWTDYEMITNAINASLKKKNS